MQRVVQRDVEPIIPFIDRVRELYESYGISTILVAGSCGSYFHKADTILQMNRYEPMEITAFAKKEAENFPMPIEQVELSKRPGMERVVKADTAFQKDNRIKMKTMGRDGISINKETVDLRYVEQLVDTEQLNALAHILKYMKLHVFMGKTTLQDGVEQLYRQMQQKGFTAFCGNNIPGNLVLPRKQEIYAMLNRCRNLIKM